MARFREPVWLLNNPRRSRRRGKKFKAQSETEDYLPYLTLTDDRYSDFRDVERHVQVHIIDAIESLESFKARFSKILLETESKNHKP
jgi:hypothetical protein